MASGLAVGLRPAPRAWMVHAGIWSTVLVLLVYLVAHVRGLPFGADQDGVADLAPLGVAAAVAQAALVLALCTLLDARARSRTLTALALVGLTVWLAEVGGALRPVPVVPGESRAAGAHAHGNPLLPLPYISDAVRREPRAPLGHERPIPSPAGR